MHNTRRGTEVVQERVVQMRTQLLQQSNLIGQLKARLGKHREISLGHV